MQLCAKTVVNLDTLQENAIVIQPVSVVVTVHAGINVVDSSLGLALAWQTEYSHQCRQAVRPKQCNGYG